MNTDFESVSPNDTDAYLLAHNEIDEISGGSDPTGFIIGPRT